MNTLLHLDGGPLSVHRHGDPAAPPVVLLHGGMLDTAPLIWRHLMPALADRWQVIAPDLPGHGGSRPWSGTLDQPRLEGVLDDLLDRLGVGRAAFVGLSLGGGLATGYALTRPRRVSALVAINPGGLDDTRPWHFLTWLLLRYKPPLRWAMRWLASSAYLRRSMAGTLTDGERTRDFAEVMALTEAEARARAAHGEAVLDDWQITAYGPRRMRLNHSSRLHGLSVPSLWVHGDRDTAVTEAVVRRAASLAPGGRFASVPGAGHLAPLDRPDVVSNLVLEFLDTTRQ
ncbi:alpha/beta fold hydrolase [Nonomuraea sp. SBT364]|uniref:alpha/beta fold hydrolase n=1 Tax=Nonomuraea sp. SBT364 TaxID=1580530 RepID=UPI00066A9B8A|nr:alpha/beta hydrolase [Nonomuraea sp. SBT364]